MWRIAALACTAALLAAPLPPAEATLAAASTHAQLAHPATIRDQLMQFADASGAAYLALSRELVNRATEVLPELRSLLDESLQTEQPTGDQLRAYSRWLSLLLQVDDGNSFGLAQQALAKSWREQGEDATACMSDGDAQSKWCELLDRSATHRVDSWLALASDATLSEVARSHALDRVIAGASIEWIVQFSTSLQGGSPELLRASIAAISRRALREPDVATSLRAALELPTASIYQSYLPKSLVVG